MRACDQRIAITRVVQGAENHCIRSACIRPDPAMSCHRRRQSAATSRVSKMRVQTVASRPRTARIPRNKVGSSATGRSPLWRPPSSAPSTSRRRLPVVHRVRTHPAHAAAIAVEKQNVGATLGRDRTALPGRCRRRVMSRSDSLARLAAALREIAIESNRCSAHLQRVECSAATRMMFRRMHGRAARAGRLSPTRYVILMAAFVFPVLAQAHST